MKKLLITMFVALLMAGCGDPDLDDKETLDEIIAEAIDFNKLQKRGELFYAPNQQTPYTGRAKYMHSDGRVLGQYRDGKPDGLWAGWYSNGLKSFEHTYKAGKLWTTDGWQPNGEKCPVTNVVNGNGVMVYYNDDGKEAYRQTYKDGNK